MYTTLMYYSTAYIMIPVFIFALICQARVKSNFKKYSQVISKTGMTGADAAWRLLQLNGITDVKIRKISGNLTDHYNPSTNEICLSENVYNSRSIAAIGVACHEAGHACQYAQGYVPIKIRSAVIPATQIGSSLGIPLCLVGLIINSEILAMIGVVLYSLVAVFQLITLPVEFNASHRALQTIEENGFLDEQEFKGAKKMLAAAAMTYVAALASALGSLFRLLVVASGDRR